eukprot:CAMPEP_0194393018 /NCGR_PEP_ID=MMETSP0174-20130528/123061_1 /TAXON_ID=216777 /ORGANISM="Proboscia alata, Strain PI-D3" /LENGTH=534 /DNA_ID=CAMNT_0039188649 /DNA_START=179 /DNA_END=1782 /DNA_ORIENTATION=-
MMITTLLLLASHLQTASTFSIRSNVATTKIAFLSHSLQNIPTAKPTTITVTTLASTPEDNTNTNSNTNAIDAVITESKSMSEMTTEEKEQIVGDLVANDEWMGFTMELAEMVRDAVNEDLKKNVVDFTGKEEYKIGDISKELDSRVKNEVAKLREKDEYELGDLSIALDTMAKDVTCEMTGKDDYEFGDLTLEIDKRVKAAPKKIISNESFSNIPKVSRRYPKTPKKNTLYSIMMLTTIILLASHFQTASTFSIRSNVATTKIAFLSHSLQNIPTAKPTTITTLASTPEDNTNTNSNTNAIDAVITESKSMSEMTTEEKEQIVGDLVANDEWMGFTMELAEMVRDAVNEDLKKNVVDFTGKEEYKIGDISKELDSRVKNEVAKLREKDEYELGDLSIALDTMAKDVTCEMTGKDDYEFGDLTLEIDKRVKASVMGYTGKENYEFGDLTKEIDNRAKKGVAEFTGKENYEFGDVTKELENRRRQWMVDVLGKENAAEYEFGDLTKKALTSITGKDDYEFGDVTKKIIGNLFNKKK